MPYANRIKLNCTNYHQIMTRPPNCYNCAMRDGFPGNLGGDDCCKNFKPVPPRKRKLQNTCVCRGTPSAERVGSREESL